MNKDKISTKNKKNESDNSDVGGVFLVNHKEAEHATRNCSLDFIKESNSRIVRLLPEKKPEAVLESCITACLDKFDRVFS